MSDDKNTEIEDIEIKLNGKYVPLLNQLTKVWGNKDINETLKNSLLLMVWLTKAREDGYKMYMQDSKGHTKEMAILQQDDVTEDVSDIQQQSYQELQKSLNLS